MYSHGVTVKFPIILVRDSSKSGFVQYAFNFHNVVFFSPFLRVFNKNINKKVKHKYGWYVPFNSIEADGFCTFSLQ